MLQNNFQENEIQRKAWQAIGAAGNIHDGDLKSEIESSAGKEGAPFFPGVQQAITGAMQKANRLIQKAQDNIAEFVAKPVRHLYRIIGNTVGRKIRTRIAASTSLKEHAKETIDAIQGVRHDLRGERNFDLVTTTLSKLYQHGAEKGAKLMAWVQEAFGLLNQSSTHVSEVFDPKQGVLAETWARNLVTELIEKDDLGYDELKQLFSQDFSANLVLTAHPTAGIKPDYARHIKGMVSAVREVADKFGRDPNLDIKDKFTDKTKLSVDSQDSEAKKKLTPFAKKIQNQLDREILLMVQSDPYYKTKIKPSDESKRFRDNLVHAWNTIPEYLRILEETLNAIVVERFGSSVEKIKLNPRAFKIHSWVARDIDGNPTVSAYQHVRSLLDERLFFLNKYKDDIQELYDDLSGSFSQERTFFVNEGFENLVKEELKIDVEQNPEVYRAVIKRVIQAPLENEIKRLEAEETKLSQKFNQKNQGRQADQFEDLSLLEMNGIDVRSKFDINENLLKPLRLISSNKREHSEHVDEIIKKAEVFGLSGSYGHTRQGKTILNKIASLWLGVEQPPENSQDQEKKSAYQKLLTEFIRSNNLRNKDFDDLKQEIESLTPANGSKQDEIFKFEKQRNKMLQTIDILRVIRFGGINRQVISMSNSINDLLSVLAIHKQIGLFKPADSSQLPQAKLDIVPLIEQIGDLRSSADFTINALLNPAWREYLIARDGRFVKMRGPSDSGKQNGFIASQWEMFKSKHFDSIVVNIFNAYLDKALNGESHSFDFWMKANKELIAENNESEEAKLIATVIQRFNDAGLLASLQDEVSLWNRAKVPSIKLIHFDGWGEPVERGGGLDFEGTVQYTQPNNTLAFLERTLQGGGASGLYFLERTRLAVKDFVYNLAKVGARWIGVDAGYGRDENEIGFAEQMKHLKEKIFLNSGFVTVMNKLIKTLRGSLRQEAFGLSLDNDLISDEKSLRDYFRHVIKSPLVFLDLFNIASRPTSRSGAQIAKWLSRDDYNNNIDAFINKLDKETIVEILDDVRAIPYAAMFSLLGGNHVSFFGFSKVIENKELLDEVARLYQQGSSTNGSQESRLIKHDIDSLEKGLMTTDIPCYINAHTLIEKATNPDYDPDQDPFLQKIIKENQATINFLAYVKYDKALGSKVGLEDLMQNQVRERALMLARRNDAAVTRTGLAITMAKILEDAKARGVNPLVEENIKDHLDLLRRSLVACTSNFGTGCLDG